MIDAISKLVESGAISEDVQKSIQEAWDSKIKENKEQVGAELREEFAKRYEHDKANMIEAIDKMMSEKLSEEISKFVEDRKALAQEKISYKENVGKHSAKLESFILSKLSEELKELHSDRKGVHENFKKMEEFVVNALAKEIKEFHEDKKGVVETKVKLVAEAKKQMAKMKEAFISKSAKIVEQAVTKKLGEELAQLKEDITKARESNFGKTIFEAFASEYQASYLNEKSETAKLMKVVDETTLKLAEAEKWKVTRKVTMGVPEKCAACEHICETILERAWVCPTCGSRPDNDHLHLGPEKKVEIQMVLFLLPRQLPKYQYLTYCTRLQAH